MSPNGSNDDEREDSLTPIEIYLNVINSSLPDSNNEAYEKLLREEDEVKRLIHITDIFDYEEDNDDIGDIDDPLFNGSLKEQEVACGIGEGKGSAKEAEMSPIPTQIHGSASMRKRLTALCESYVDIFSRSVKKTPAKITAMTLDVDRAEWERPYNRLPAWPQSAPNQEEIRKQLTKMLDLGVISPSRSTNWSQVLLAAKSNGSKRFCIDLRALNKALRDQGWQIPNIKELIDRIGALKMQFYATMDLTSGYHQFPMDPRSAWMTAFVTFMGVFEWNRVPMGVKPAANYFQRTMSQEVLPGLIYNCCEVYIDDILVYGRTEDEYIENLRKVFQRFREKGITLNPDKCIFGADEVEFVGHVLDATGVTFSRTKFDSVVDFIKPSNMKELRSFVGLVNYFRDHIQDHSVITHPLQLMISEGAKTKMIRVPGKKPLQYIRWTPEAEVSFADIKDKINSCPKLFFMDEKLPIFLHTDASDYAIGAYLFQVKDGKEIPIRFMSKTLAGAQLRWSTIEKECYAMYHSLKKFADLLLGVPFVLRTDHFNLLYLNEAGSAKVTRWKIEIQNYNFHIEHIPGVDNIPADAFSRLVEPHVGKTVQLNALTRSQGGPRGQTEGSAAINQILQGVTGGSFGGQEVLQARGEAVRRGPTEGSAAINQILRGVTEEGSVSQAEPEATITIAQPSYSEERGVALARHHGPLGHFGVDRTFASALASGLDANHLKEDITEFIKFCPTCQKMSYVRPIIYSTPYVSSGTKPMHEVHMDTVGPWAPDKDGYTQVIVIIDNFTRYVTLHRSKDTTAKAAAEAFFNHCCTYGVPKVIHSDNGTQYVNILISDLTKMFNVKHNLSIAYSSQQNGICERVNKEVNRHLRMLTEGSNKTDIWSSFLPLVQRIINASEHTSTGYSPSQLMFGDSVDHRHGLFPGSDNLTPPTTDIDEWVHELIVKQTAMF